MAWMVCFLNCLHRPKLTCPPTSQHGTWGCLLGTCSSSSPPARFRRVPYHRICSISRDIAQACSGFLPPLSGPATMSELVGCSRHFQGLNSQHGSWQLAKTMRLHAEALDRNSLPEFMDVSWIWEGKLSGKYKVRTCFGPPLRK